MFKNAIKKLFNGAKLAAVGAYALTQVLQPIIAQAAPAEVPVAQEQPVVEVRSNVASDPVGEEFAEVAAAGVKDQTIVLENLPNCSENPLPIATYLGEGQGTYTANPGTELWVKRFGPTRMEPVASPYESTRDAESSPERVWEVNALGIYTSSLYISSTLIMTVPANSELQMTWGDDDNDTRLTKAGINGAYLDYAQLMTNSDIFWNTSDVPARFEFISADSFWFLACVRQLSPPTPLGSIGDFVWYDTNNDGLQTAGEEGVSGVTVYLYNAAQQMISSDVTDESGLYLFENLPAGNYYIVFAKNTLPTGYELVNPDQGGDDALDSDANLSQGMSTVIELAPGETDLTVDAGIKPIVKEFPFCSASFTPGLNVGDDKVRGSVIAEAGPNATEWQVTSYEGEIVAASGQGGTFMGTLDLHANTWWRFQAKLPNYNGWFSTQACDMYVTRMNPGLIGNVLWYDANNDGVQNDGEPVEMGIEDAIVELYDCADNKIRQTITSNTGVYNFSELNAGCYKVKFPLLTGYSFSPANQGPDDELDSDVGDATGFSHQIDLRQGAIDLSIDAGLYAPVEINKEYRVGSTCADLWYRLRNGSINQGYASLEFGGNVYPNWRYDFEAGDELAEGRTQWAPIVPQGRVVAKWFGYINWADSTRSPYSGMEIHNCPVPEEPMGCSHVINWTGGSGMVVGGKQVSAIPVFFGPAAMARVFVQDGDTEREIARDLPLNPTIWWGMPETQYWIQLADASGIYRGTTCPVMTPTNVCAANAQDPDCGEPDIATVEPLYLPLISN